MDRGRYITRILVFLKKSIRKRLRRSQWLWMILAAVFCTLLFVPTILEVAAASAADALRKLEQLDTLSRSWTRGAIEERRTQYAAPIAQWIVDIVLALALATCIDMLLMTFAAFCLQLSGWKEAMPLSRDSQTSGEEMRTPVSFPPCSEGADLGGGEGCRGGDQGDGVDDGRTGGSGQDGHHPKVQRQLSWEKKRWFPKVLVQIAMYNERECYQLSIGACARLDWPRDRLLVQVLDDSDEEEMKSLVDDEVERWVKEGVEMVVNRRADRSGFKGGNLKSGFEAPYTKEYEFIAMFDADFQPEPDFLARTIPYFRDDPRVALVQARWEFNNSYQNILTRTQLIDMSYHFSVEQQVQAATGLFFQFNGTAGVWRRSAIVDAGGWLTRTTVEDMDLSFRAFLRGWRFKYLDQVRVVSENPTSVRAYSRQQHRWFAGPARLLVLVFADILRCKHLSFSNKFHMLVMFIFFRKIVASIVGAALAFLVPLLFVLIPELTLPLPIALVAISLGAVVARILSGRQESLLACLPIVAPYIWVASSVSVTKAIGCVQGLLDRPEASEWVVTEKTGVRKGHEECDDDEEDGEEAGGEVEGDKAVGGRAVGREEEKTTLSCDGCDSRFDASSAAAAGEDVERGQCHAEDKMGVGPRPPPPSSAGRPRRKKKRTVLKAQLFLALLILSACIPAFLSARALFYYIFFQSLVTLAFACSFLGDG